MGHQKIDSKMSAPSIHRSNLPFKFVHRKDKCFEILLLFFVFGWMICCFQFRLREPHQPQPHLLKAKVLCFVLQSSISQLPFSPSFLGCRGHLYLQMLFLFSYFGPTLKSYQESCRNLVNNGNAMMIFLFAANITRTNRF